MTRRSCGPPPRRQDEKRAICFLPLRGRYRGREVGGGRATRQPGQVRKEAALTSAVRVARQPPTLSYRCSPRLSGANSGTSQLECCSWVSSSLASAGHLGRTVGSTQATFRPWISATLIRATNAIMNDATTTAGSSYRVLARKYRPSTFADLIGQDAMVRTISNAFESGRIPQAWVLTGVRGVGKTTTARILARALNYELPDGSVTGPTIAMPVLGVHCQAIMESRHLDVIEMDAASHNGVEDVRAINEAIRYAPVSARYKVYILDEVHMLSGAAFNALLKTLEEPPAHAKFVFATTEIRKVPITVLSRCQRFDLRRVDAALLVKHLQGIAEKEAITAEPEALGLIARAAEGSVRDALSLLDQAIAHSGAGSGDGNTTNTAGPVRAEDVRQMLGLADRTKIIDLFEALDARRSAARAGRSARAIRCRRRSGDGARRSCRVHAFRHPREDRAGIGRRCFADRSRAHARARVCRKALDARAGAHLADAAQGLEEVAAAGRPLAAAEMVLVRIAYAADLPTPDEVIRSLGDTCARQRRRRSIRRPGVAARRHAGADGSALRNAARRHRARRSPQRRSNWRRGAAGAQRRNGYAGARACELRGAGGARRRKARYRHQERARARRAAGAFRRRPARIRPRSRARRNRSPANCRRSSPTGPAAAGW